MVMRDENPLKMTANTTHGPCKFEAEVQKWMARLKDAASSSQEPPSRLRPLFFYFLFYQFFSQQFRVGGQNKHKNKIHLDQFPIELKSKETRFRVSFDFNSIGKWSE